MHLSAPCNKQCITAYNCCQLLYAVYSKFFFIKKPADITAGLNSCYFISSQKLMALAAATFSESTPSVSTSMERGPYPFIIPSGR